MTTKSTRFVSYKFVDSKGVLRDKIVKTGWELKQTYFDGSSFGFCPTSKSDLLLVPDLSTEHFDPIRNMTSVFCFLQYPDNTPLDEDFRTQALLAMSEDEQTRGALFGVEPEFFIRQKDSGLPIGVEDANELRSAEQFQWYGSLPPIDKFQWLRDIIAEKLDKAGIDVEAMHHEVAPGQCEFSWVCDNLLRTADKMLLFKYIVSAVCDSHDLIADFQAKPFEELNGNGCHVHQSVPIMRADKNYVDTDKLLEAYAQGLVDHYHELLAVCCVGKSSKARLVPGFEAPTEENNGWGWHDRTKTVRIPGAGGRVELRLADPDMNPYVALPLMLKFGYECVRKAKDKE